MFLLSSPWHTVQTGPPAFQALAASTPAIETDVPPPEGLAIKILKDCVCVCTYLTSGKKLKTNKQMNRNLSLLQLSTHFLLHEP